MELERLKELIGKTVKQTILGKKVTILGILDDGEYDKIKAVVHYNEDKKNRSRCYLAGLDVLEEIIDPELLPIELGLGTKLDIEFIPEIQDWEDAVEPSKTIRVVVVPAMMMPGYDTDSCGFMIDGTYNVFSRTLVRRHTTLKDLKELINSDWSYQDKYGMVYRIKPVGVRG